MYIIVTDKEDLIAKAKDEGCEIYTISNYNKRQLIPEELKLTTDVKEFTHPLSDYNITEFLMHLHILPHHSGFMYLKYAISCYLANKNFGKKGITRELYPCIAENFNTTSSRVERAIRHAIQASFVKKPLSNLQQEIFPYIDREFPTNFQYIKAIFIYLEENFN